MKCRWQHCLACIHPHQPTPLMDHSIQCCGIDSAHSWSYTLKRAITAKSTSRNGGRRRQEPDEPWFKSKFSSAILGSCGTTAFVVSTFRSRVSSVSALRTGQGQHCYMAWVALHEPEPAAALWDVFKKHLLDSLCIYKPLTTHVPF